MGILGIKIRALPGALELWIPYHLFDIRNSHSRLALGFDVRKVVHAIFFISYRKQCDSHVLAANTCVFCHNVTLFITTSSEKTLFLHQLPNNLKRSH